MTPQSSAPVHSRVRHVLGWALGVLTFASTLMGFYFLNDYKARPGEAALAPMMWPTDSAVKRDSERPTVLLFAHPLCPCTRASLSELQRVLEAAEGGAVGRVVFTIEGGLDGLPEEGVLAIAGAPALVDRAKAIPDTSLYFDNDGIYRAEFGSATSGQVLAYDSDGRLIFSGGVTSSRSHEGENNNANLLLAALKADKKAAPVLGSLPTTPVYGCSLKEPERALISP